MAGGEPGQVQGGNAQEGRRLGKPSKDKPGRANHNYHETAPCVTATGSQKGALPHHEQ